MLVISKNIAIQIQYCGFARYEKQGDNSYIDHYFVIPLISMLWLVEKFWLALITAPLPFELDCTQIIIIILPQKTVEILEGFVC